MTEYHLILPDFPHAGALVELVQSIAHGLRQQGHQCHVTDVLRPTVKRIGVRDIVFGAHVLLGDTPPGTIVYDSEAPNSMWHQRAEYKRVLERAADVWTVYDHQPDVVPLPGLEQLPRSKRALFYGSLNERRCAVLEPLGAGVTWLFGVYGARRDESIDRAGVVLDLKWDAKDPNNRVRAFWAYSRGAPVLSENDSRPERRLDTSRLREQIADVLANPEPYRVPWWH